MLKIAKLTVALAVAGLALPAFAQWPKGPSQRPATPAAKSASVAKAPVKSSASGLANGGFTYRGDGTGWEITPHKYVFSNGSLVMSDECDHVTRIVKGPTVQEVDSTRNLSPGA